MFVCNLKFVTPGANLPTFCEGSATVIVLDCCGTKLITVGFTVNKVSSVDKFTLYDLSVDVFLNVYVIGCGYCSVYLSYTKDTLDDVIETNTGSKQNPPTAPV